MFEYYGSVQRILNNDFKFRTTKKMICDVCKSKEYKWLTDSFGKNLMSESRENGFYNYKNKYAVWHVGIPECSDVVFYFKNKNDMNAFDENMPNIAMKLPHTKEVFPWISKNIKDYYWYSNENIIFTGPKAASNASLFKLVWF